MAKRNHDAILSNLDEVRESTRLRLEQFQTPFTLRASGELRDRIIAAAQVCKEIGSSELVFCAEPGRIMIESAFRTVWCVSVLKTADITVASPAPTVLAVDSKIFYDSVNHATKNLIVSASTDALLVSLDLTGEQRHSLKSDVALLNEPVRVEESIYHFESSSAIEFSFKTFSDGIKAMVGEQITLTLNREQRQLEINSRSDGVTKRFTIPVLSAPEGFPSTSVSVHSKHIKAILHKMGSDVIQIRLCLEKVEFRCVYPDDSYVALIVSTIDEAYASEPY